MRAARFSRYGNPDVLQIVDISERHAMHGQIRIAVHAAGINATECKLRQGLLDFGDGLPQCTGRDIAGVVDEIGDGVTGVCVGDLIFGVSDDGAGAAEYAVATHWAPIPKGLGMIDAAGLACALETATRSLDALGLRRGMTLLINGASGGIGSTAVQLARARGVHVIGTASAAGHTYLATLGAKAVSYGPRMSDEVRALAPDGVDRALDVAGHDALPQLIALARGAQHVVTLADADGAKRHGVRFSSGADGHAFHALRDVGALIEAGRFWLSVERTFMLNEIAEAHRTLENNHVRGRVVLLVR